MLRVVLEFDDVEMAVISAHEMRLRSTAHPSYVLDSFYGHGAKIVLGFQYHQPWAFSTKQGRSLKYKAKGSNGGMQNNQVEVSKLPPLPLRFKVFADL